MQIPTDVLAVLADPRTIISGERVAVPFELDRGLYDRMNQMLKGIGGRWDGRKAVRAHVFPFPVEQFMRDCLAAGEWPSRFEQGWYPTPPAVAFDMLEHASIRVGHTVLEPSAGTGSLAKRAAEEMGIVDCVEIDPPEPTSSENSAPPARSSRATSSTSTRSPSTSRTTAS
ncbi:hypothetical protein OOK58_42310 [Streptomyces sp. NBC_01728]|uniref:hypothetical protein n=1 Tax=unclassified Streptomyces TaxID=2593676 RepID=UPI00224D8B0D|nr:MULTISPECIES: hypothetical protein [unclassified Streptomyces]MCX4458550.1 hypothetical protein [Streptomyces sp. NBC_01719]MCX4497907.1 hypothetical protein [Streptomyces sp. NBC_01728]